MQLDVTYIMRKLIFFDAVISKLLEPHEIEALCLLDKSSLTTAKEERKKHFALDFMRKERNDREEERERSSEHDNTINISKN